MGALVFIFTQTPLYKPRKVRHYSVSAGTLLIMYFTKNSQKEPGCEIEIKMKSACK
jgi:hypothetical protein